jgi:hypothetical protein
MSRYVLKGTKIIIGSFVYNASSAALRAVSRQFQGEVQSTRHISQVSLYDGAWLVRGFGLFAKIEPSLVVAKWRNRNEQPNPDNKLTNTINLINI